MCDAEYDEDEFAQLQGNQNFGRYLDLLYYVVDYFFQFQSPQQSQHSRDS
jgi:hypothetical protein